MLAQHSRGFAEVRFWNVHYVDSPVVMHNARMRLGNAEDTARVRSYLHPESTGRLRDEHHLVIEAQEGVFSIWGWGGEVTWLPHPASTFAGAVVAPLWERGPAPLDL